MGSGLRIVEDNSLRVTEGGYQVQLHLNWYRSLPLSCIDRIKLVIDGQPVDPSAMCFGINDHQYHLDELADLVEEFWFVQDPAQLIVQQSGKVKHGESHAIDVEIALRFPYIPIGPGKFLVNTSKYSETQVAS